MYRKGSAAWTSQKPAAEGSKPKATNGSSVGTRNAVKRWVRSFLNVSGWVCRCRHFAQRGCGAEDSSSHELHIPVATSIGSKQQQHIDGVPGLGDTKSQDDMDPAVDSGTAELVDSGNEPRMPPAFNAGRGLVTIKLGSPRMDREGDIVTLRVGDTVRLLREWFDTTLRAGSGCPREPGRISAAE